MATLHECLNNTPRRTLLSMAQLNGLTPATSSPKAKLVELLYTTLPEPGHLQRVVLHLAEQERAVLSTLLAAGSRLSQADFERRFGRIRPYKPWRGEMPRQPWRNPTGPGERPFYLGLIFFGLGPGQWRDEPYLLIPDELVPHLSMLVAPSPAEAAGTAPPDAPAQLVQPDVCRDVAALLGLLHRQDIQLLHDRWLPSRPLADWNARCSVPEPLDSFRSELQTRRLRALHFLAQAAGLVGNAGQCLKPTPLGWQWLDGDRTAQLQTLWHAWPSDLVLWRVYHLPGHACPIILSVLTGLLPYLAQAATGGWLATTDFVQAVLAAEPPLTYGWEHWTPDFQTGTLTDFVTGFLAHLGAVEVSSLPDSAASSPADKFRITSLGGWLLGIAPAPEWPSIQPFVLALAPDAQGRLSVEVPRHPNLAHLVRLEAFAEWDSGRYALTPESLNRAYGRGARPEELIGLLDEATAQPVPPALRATLRAWEAESTQMTLSRPALLECQDQAILSHLARKRRFRRYIVRTLSSRAVILDDAHVGAAVRHLHREGYTPRLTLPDSQVQATAPAGRTTAAIQLLAGQVYQGLAQFIRLPAPIPFELLSEWAQTLSPAELAAAEAQAVRVLESLASALDGWTPQPSPQPGLDPETLRRQIEAAILEKRCLQLSYWSAGRGVLTNRQVEPYRLEERGHTLYLVGHCLQVRAERVFRLDRIQAMDVIDQPDDWSPDFD
jgi:hypothetical protein